VTCAGQRFACLILLAETFAQTKHCMFATQCLRTPAALPPQIACKADARYFGPVPSGRRFRFDASVGVLLMDESGREGLDLR
jgi:hypothetical protein